MLQHYSDVVRWTLLVAGGYECQEQEGNYMIAFHSAAAALEWALLLQEALMEVNWSNEVRASKGAARSVTSHVPVAVLCEHPAGACKVPSFVDRWAQQSLNNT
jgi:hypothetical protein